MKTTGLVLAVISGLTALAFFAMGEVAIGFACLTPCSVIGTQLVLSDSGSDEDDE